MINNIGRFQQNPKTWLQVYWANIVLQHKPNTVTEQWSPADCHPPNAYVCAIIDKVRCVPLCSTTVSIRLRLSSLFSLCRKYWWKFEGGTVISCAVVIFYFLQFKTIQIHQADEGTQQVSKGNLAYKPSKYYQNISNQKTCSGNPNQSEGWHILNIKVHDSLVNRWLLCWRNSTNR